MKKILLIMLMFLFITPVYAEEFNISSKNVIMYNMNDDSVIYQKEANEKVQIASLTKIMTTIIGIENIEDLNSNVTMTTNAFNDLEDYAKSGLKVGDTITYNDLLYAIMLPSGADAAQQLAISVSDNIDSFVVLMNKKAKELGLKNTKFSNVIGKDDINNYSTAKDVSTLLKYCLKNKIFKMIFTTKSYSIKSANVSFNSTLNMYSKKYGIDTSYIKGSKTGYTEGAGVCLASIATIKDVDYLLIVLGANYEDFFANHIKDSITLYDYYSSNYSYRDIVQKGDLIVTLPVKYSKTKRVDLTFDETITKYLKNNVDLYNIVIDYDGVKEITRKNYKNKLGTASIILNNKVLATTDVNLNQEIKFYDIKLIVLLVFIILTIITFIIKYKNRHKDYALENF